MRISLPIPLTASQLRAARALLRLSAADLAEVSGISLITIREAGALDGPVRMMAANEKQIRKTLDEAGVKFIPQNGGGAGVRLVKPTPGRGE